MANLGALSAFSQLNALMPKLRLELPLDQEIRSLVRHYGVDAVRAAVKCETAKKRGRKQEKDWLLLKPFIEQDTADWFAGRDPFELRTNYAIAKAVSEQTRGHSITSTHRRLMRKLAEGRRRMMLITAMIEAEKERPYLELFRVLEELSKLDGVAGEIGWGGFDYRNGQLQRYRETIGEPLSEMTFEQIREELNKPKNEPALVPGLAGLFGSARGA